MMVFETEKRPGFPFCIFLNGTYGYPPDVRLAIDEGVRE